MGVFRKTITYMGVLTIARLWLVVKKGTPFAAKGEAMAKSLLDTRREVRAAIKKRGRRRYDVWSVYGAKGNRDFSIDGTPNADHLVWMEGDPSVVSYTIPTQKIVGQGSEAPEGTIPDAICVLTSGEVEWREIKTEDTAKKLKIEHSEQILAQTSLAEKYGARWRLITTADLIKHTLLIYNWRQGLAYITSALNYDLAHYEQDVLFVVGNDRSVRLSNILHAYPPENEPLLVAAFFRLVQKGELSTDLATKEFGLETKVRRLDPEEKEQYGRR